MDCEDGTNEVVVGVVGDVVDCVDCVDGSDDAVVGVVTEAVVVSVEDSEPQLAGVGPCTTDPDIFRFDTEK